MAKKTFFITAGDKIENWDCSDVRTHLCKEDLLTEAIEEWNDELVYEVEVKRVFKIKSKPSLELVEGEQ